MPLPIPGYGGVGDAGRELLEHGIDDEPVDDAAIARGAGIEAICIERLGDIIEGLKRAFARPGLFLVGLVADPNAF
ncbi:hypothetical protein ACGF5O_37790 [Streptomyces sp. NPDC048291]|uniref:hypothetical protein n=1 Tax=Streptomyces sp. NPDC048291 TaxID=3365530 RepID=UPI00371888A0